MSIDRISWEEAVAWLRQQPDKQDLVRDCYYDDPLENAAERYSNSEEWQAVKYLLGKRIPGKVLDVGAGRGISRYAFARLGCAVTALEPDSGALVGAEAIRTLFASARMPINVIEEYGEALPFEENTFNIVYERAVLHHARDLVKLCREARRVLKQGGIFIATREHVISRKEDLGLFLEAHPLHQLHGAENAHLLQEYREAIKAGGFKIEKIIGPFESVINYAPMSRRAFQQMTISALTRRFGSQLAAKLGSNLTIQQIYGRYLSQRSNVPGRLYTFLGVKK